MPENLVKKHEKEIAMHIYSKFRYKFLLCLPALVIFGVFMVYPILDTLYTSLFDKYMLKPGIFVGLNNYKKAFQDEYFILGLKNTFIIVVCTFLTQLPLAFFLGKFLSAPNYKNGAFKTISFIPYILSGIMTGLIWSFLLDPTIGLFNNLLLKVGMKPLIWIGGKTLTPYSVSLVLLWQAVGYHSVLFMAGFKMMPKDVIEAASIDGANALQRNWYVVIPSIKETIKMSATLILVGGINQYQQTFMLTGGGPSHYSETIGTYTYNVDFVSYQFGYGSALATIILALALGLTVIMLQLSSGKDDIA